MRQIISIKSLLTVVVLLLSTATFAQKNVAPWKSLFNGVNLDNWKMVGDKGEAFVEDGEILIRQTANTKNHTFVTSVDKYSDFILEVDFKMDAPGFSTAVLIRGVEETPTTGASVSQLNGYQIKIDNTPRNWTGGIFDFNEKTLKWLYDLSNNEPARQAFKLNDWNSFRIEAIGNTIKVWINGVPSTNLVNNKYTDGYIALKIHSLSAATKDQDVLVRFRNIRVITKNVASYVKSMDLEQIKVE